MRAAGEVDADGLVQFHPLVQIIHHGDGMALGFAGGVFAIAVSGAGHKSAAQMRLGGIKTQFLQQLANRWHKCFRDNWDDEILPNGQSHLTAAVGVCDVGDAVELFCRELSHRDGGTDIK